MRIGQDPDIVLLGDTATGAARPHDLLLQPLAAGVEGTPQRVVRIS
jgi:hypothetical protein